MEEEDNNEEGDSGLPGWVMTFADLMSLLMCFFVLLLSFSEMDLLKFKQLAGSMQNAFGVQAQQRVMEMPKGTSIIAQEFSPGKPVPSNIPRIEQITTDDSKQNLDFTDSTEKGQSGEGGHQQKAPNAQSSMTFKQAQEKVDEVVTEQLENLAETIREALDQDIKAGLIEVITQHNEILIRIREQGSFPSASARVQRTFYPIMDRLTGVLNKVNGQIVVSGHTDNLPIRTRQYPSNWILSAARAATVVHYMTKSGQVPHERIEIRAHAESQPVVPNNSDANRAKNRRVEVIVKYDGATEEMILDDQRQIEAQIKSPT